MIHIQDLQQDGPLLESMPVPTRPYCPPEEMATSGFKFRCIGFWLSATPLPWIDSIYAFQSRECALVHFLCISGHLINLHWLIAFTHGPECCHKNHKFKSAVKTTSSWLEPTPLLRQPHVQARSLPDHEPCLSQPVNSHQLKCHTSKTKYGLLPRVPVSSKWNDVIY